MGREPQRPNVAQGRQQLDVPAIGAVAGDTIDLSPLAAKHPALDVTLTVSDAEDRLISRYQRTVRFVPEELLTAANGK